MYVMLHTVIDPANVPIGRGQPVQLDEPVEEDYDQDAAGNHDMSPLPATAPLPHTNNGMPLQWAGQSKLPFYSPSAQCYVGHFAENVCKTAPGKADLAALQPGTDGSYLSPVNACARPFTEDELGCNMRLPLTTTTTRWLYGSTVMVLFLHSASIFNSTPVHMTRACSSCSGLV